MRPRLDLALQGGGSHGAFTWGVLDALLEADRYTLDGVSGTSAGAMNAAVLACGVARGGAQGGREALRAFWLDVAGVPECLGASVGRTPSPLSALPTFPAWLFNRDAWPLYGLWESWWKSLSPYQFNPLNLNPLRDILQRHVDVALLRGGPLKVQVTATAVSTGQPRVFNDGTLSIEALLASACLPQMSQAVEIDGEAYWDGGYSGNPAIWPLIYGTEAVDVLLVQINPLVRPGVPTRAAEIADRMNEITFNASLVAEMRAIAFVQKLVREQRVSADDYKDLRLHRVADEEGLAPFDASSKLNTDIRLLETLFGLGRAAATRWLAEHGDAVGQQGTVDIGQTWLAPRAQPGPGGR
ncbi:patatin-like phospholipase family protein [Leptothrix discophora]|uniref:Patatin-like phospholipase family protein n=1 Tax=Leptothrix discophora TaxID=89 RepID=A0ABT9FZW8_LEPDI|nr:patatin-like phospholipase family protein [Leptothrix discophora]MDP4299774.1 patatin-like phospholipase family protein [Leptothrix discophora]